MTSEQKDVRSELPVCPAERPEQWNGVRVEGMVETPLFISLQELSEAPQTESVQDVKCYDGWVAPGQRWEGVALSAVLSQAGYSEDAGFVSASCLDFQWSLTLEEALAPGTILALRLNGQPLPEEHGGPCRLVAAGKMGPHFVKLPERIEVTREAPEK